jgi:hypothetical protein
MRRTGIGFACALAWGCGGQELDAAARSGEEPCTKPRVALSPPAGTGDATSVDLDVSPRPGREKILYEGRRLEVRDVGGELLLAIDRSMDPAELPLPTVLRWTRSALPRADLLLQFPVRTAPAGGTAGCEVDETRLVVYRDLVPGSPAAMEEVVRREAGCGVAGFRVRARICGDGDVVRLGKRTRGEPPRRSVRRWDDVSKTFGAAVSP